MKNKEQEKNALIVFPIREVSKITGVNSVTLRAWERRYGLLRPQRTSKGHRLYSENDIELIKSILSWLDRGVAISQAGDLVKQKKVSNKKDLYLDDVWHNYKQSFISAIQNLNENKLDEIYNQALAIYPIDTVNDKLITPLLKALKSDWLQSKTAQLEKNFTEDFIRTKLLIRLYHNNKNNRGPRILIAGLEGETSEIGLLTLALSIATSGMIVHSFGLGLSTNCIMIAAKKIQCSAIVLFSDHALSHNIINKDLAKLIKHSDHPVCIAGDCNIINTIDIHNIGAYTLNSNTKQAIQKLHELLNYQMTWK